MPFVPFYFQTIKRQSLLGWKDCLPTAPLQRFYDSKLCCIGKWGKSGGRSLEHPWMIHTLLEHTARHQFFRHFIKVVQLPAQTASDRELISPFEIIQLFPVHLHV